MGEGWAETLKKICKHWIKEILKPFWFISSKPFQNI